jgi:maleylacetate reductase
MALHHKLCHTLGGTFNLPHAETHTIILPHALAYNSKAAPEAMQRIAKAIGASGAATGLFDLAKDLGAPTALKDIGFKEQEIEHALKVALSNPYWNPEPIVEGAIRELLRNAWEGNRPSV